MSLGFPLTTDQLSTKKFKSHAAIFASYLKMAEVCLDRDVPAVYEMIEVDKKCANANQRDQQIASGEAKKKILWHCILCRTSTLIAIFAIAVALVFSTSAMGISYLAWFEVENICTSGRQDIREREKYFKSNVQQLMANVGHHGNFFLTCSQCDRTGSDGN